MPPDHAADLVVLLASGRADALSGRFFTIKDDLLGLVDRAGRSFDPTDKAADNQR